MYLSTAIRPDIAYSVNIPTKTPDCLASNSNSVKITLEYMKGTSYYVLLYPSNYSARQLKIYNNADYEGDSTPDIWL